MRAADSDPSERASVAASGEDEWALPLDDGQSSGARFKWGWNSETADATVWKVDGPGDGFPSHNAYLTTAWGRRPNHSAGDVVGFADRIPPTLWIHAYYGRPVPDAVVACFRAAYPDGTIIAGTASREGA